MAAKFRSMAERLNCSFDRFIRTTDADHLASTHELWRRMEERGDIYLSKYSGWYSVRDEAYYDERRADAAARRLLARAQRHAGRMDRGGELFLPPLRLSGPAARPLRGNPSFIGPETRRNEIVSFVRSGPAGPLDQPHHLRLGPAGAGRSEARDVCLGRCAQQLHDRLRLSRTRATRAGITGRRTCTSSARTSCVFTRSIGRPS